MRVLAIVHQRDAGPGVFAEAIAAAGGGLDEWTPAERPRPPADPFSYDAVLVLGGAMNVDEGDRHGWIVAEEALLREPCAWALQFHPEVGRKDALHWIDDYEADPDAVRIGIDPAVVALETEQKMGAFNELGRDLCARWLEASTGRLSEKSAAG